MKNGGFILIARPEASGVQENIVDEKLGIGKIGEPLSALNQNYFWNYTPPDNRKKVIARFK